MPNTKSAERRMRNSARKQVHNRSINTRLHTLEKKFTELLGAGKRGCRQSLARRGFRPGQSRQKRHRAQGPRQPQEIPPGPTIQQAQPARCCSRRIGRLGLNDASALPTAIGGAKRKTPTGRHHSRGNNFDLINPIFASRNIDPVERQPKPYLMLRRKLMDEASGKYLVGQLTSPMV